MQSGLTNRLKLNDIIQGTVAYIRRAAIRQEGNPLSEVSFVMLPCVGFLQALNDSLHIRTLLFAPWLSFDSHRSSTKDL